MCEIRIVLKGQPGRMIHDGGLRDVQQGAEATGAAALPPNANIDESR
jgi:hypothetical protein